MIYTEKRGGKGWLVEDFFLLFLQEKNSYTLNV
jgi:hypothetical protein